MDENKPYLQYIKSEQYEQYTKGSKWYCEMHIFKI